MVAIGYLQEYAARALAPVIKSYLDHNVPYGDNSQLSAHMASDAVSSLSGYMAEAAWHRRGELASSVRADITDLFRQENSSPWQNTRGFIASLYTGINRSIGAGSRYDHDLQNAGIAPCPGGCGTRFFGTIRKGGDLSEALSGMRQACSRYGAAPESVYRTMRTCGVGGCGSGDDGNGSDGNGGGGDDDPLKGLVVDEREGEMVRSGDTWYGPDGTEYDRVDQPWNWEPIFNPRKKE